MRTSINNTSGKSYDEYYAEKRGAKPVVTRTAEEQRGVPMGNFVLRDECQGVTKTGDSCRARPVRGSQLCAGHQKQADSMFEELDG